MLKSLRQVALIVDNLPQALTLYEDILGMKPCHSEALPEYGLVNAVLPAGEGTFVELLQPTDPTSAGARFLQRRGEGMYLLIFTTDQYDTLLAHLKAKGVRITEEITRPDYRTCFIHPLSVNGTFIELVETPKGPNTWPAAGPDWYKRQWMPLTKRIRQVAVLVRNLDDAIRHWGDLFGLKPTNRFTLTFTDLEIAILPLQDRESFVELAQPTSTDGPAGRFMARFGEGPYLLIYQVEDADRVEGHLRSKGVRITTAAETPGYGRQGAGIKSVWIHPRAMRGVFTQLSQSLRPDHPWPPAGDAWLRGG
ncbi:MAG: VOC family protein [Dehalococcoidia bacterium]